MQLLFLVVAALSFCVASVAQPQRGKSNPINGLLLPIPDAPLSLEAELVEETVQPDGTTTKETKHGQLFRDSAGRTFATTENWPFSAITDPVAGIRYLMIAQVSRAFRVSLPKAVPGAKPRFAFFGVGSELMLDPGKKDHKQEDLGKRTIDGIEFVGSRTITTMVDEPSRTAIDEHWISPELGIIGIILNSSPRVKTTVKIQNLIRKEPEASLFVLPLGYTVEEFPTLGTPP